ncbi:taurine catabolism dioxygenase [Apiospora kogelbergensis]|uniref:Taurine catabolism dioxygenase n=1 Tax=Apiospora kogelbergensis TaxID=1337665 RepID=A0AAW0R796_9PEZI
MARAKESLELSGTLTGFKSFDVTPIIGTEFVDANLKDWLESPNSEQLLHELAITVSRRGVVFFRKQDGLTDEMQKTIVQRLGILAGKPATSSLHRHAVKIAGQDDEEILLINSEENKKILGGTIYDPSFQLRQSCRPLWLCDISYEPVPSDYCLLRLTEVPESGGDTLWASGYELYDRLSKPLQSLLETLSATHQELRKRDETDPRFQIPRGSPENVGTNLNPVHPLIRTHPVTRWKSVYGIGLHIKHINNVTPEESDWLMERLSRLLVENHDLQVRFRWNNRNDVAIWDNRCTYHAATYDHDGYGVREGRRVCGVGEKPFFDPKSQSRRVALAAEKER